MYSTCTRDSQHVKKWNKSDPYFVVSSRIDQFDSDEATETDSEPHSNDTTRLEYEQEREDEVMTHI